MIKKYKRKISLRRAKYTRVWMDVPKEDLILAHPSQLRTYKMLYEIRLLKYTKQLEEIGLKKGSIKLVYEMLIRGWWYDPANSFERGTKCFRNRRGRRKYFRSWAEVDSYLKSRGRK